MINTETIQFIALLNELAEKSKNGIHPFSTVANQPKECLLYDDSQVFQGVHPLVADYLVDDEHDDIISTYTQMYDEEGIVIGVKGDEDDEAYVSVTSRKDPDFCIVIEDGIWYTA
jgi:hypothetical protein